MAARVHHIGIAVRDLEKAARFFYEVFGVGTEAVEHEKVKNLYLPFENFQLQICEDPGRVGNAEFGRLDHIAITVDDLDATTAALKSQGVSMVWDEHVAVKQYRSNFSKEDGGVGVMFQLNDELAAERGGAEFKPEMMADLAKI